MAGKIKSNKTTVSATAAYVIRGKRDWAEITNTDASITIKGRYDAVADSSNWDFTIPPYTTKTWDAGLSNNISLVTDSSTAVATVESN